MRKVQVTINLSKELLEHLKGEAKRKHNLKTLRLDNKLYEELKQISQVMGFSVNAVLILIIWSYLLKTEQQERRQHYL